ncbi:MAG: dipeptide ABC transporter ATP-binding protein [Deltaproteobacteria bacterium]|nr:dipeptide ABC transporter ATP-binding protein [Deltaproteobacteria bacterium]
MAELLEVYNMVKHFPVRRGLMRSRREYVHAVDGISFSVDSEQTMGLVGESGCGKSTAGRAILRLIRPTSGEVRFKGENLLTMDAGQERQMRRQMQMIFQDPFGSLNPRLTVERIVEEPLLTHREGNGRERRERVADILRIVGLLPEHMKRFPHEFSGGQRQRIMIARALVLQPELIICDEPVSALDVSVQAQIINLMVRLQREFRFSYIIISHDLSVIRYVSHKVAVMYLGQIVEMAPAATLYATPRHPYTLALLSAVPMPDPRYKRQRIILSGDVPSPINPPAGCRFHPRCPRRMDVCEQTAPIMREVGRQHVVACHLYTDGPEWRPVPPGKPIKAAGRSGASAAGI